MKKIVGLIGGVVFAVLLYRAFFIAVEKQSPYESNKQISTAKGPTEEQNGAGLSDDGALIYIYRMATTSPDLYKSCQNYLGEKYAYLRLIINNKKGVDIYRWHCWNNKIKVVLYDGRESNSFDISEKEGFFELPESISTQFECSFSTIPGDLTDKSLAFYPDFAWRNITEIYFYIDYKWQKAQWVVVQ